MIWVLGLANKLILKGVDFGHKGSITAIMLEIICILFFFSPPPAISLTFYQLLTVVWGAELGEGPAPPLPPPPSCLSYPPPPPPPPPKSLPPGRKLLSLPPGRTPQSLAPFSCPCLAHRARAQHSHQQWTASHGSALWVMFGRSWSRHFQMQLHQLEKSSHSAKTQYIMQHS